MNLKTILATTTLVALFACAASEAKADTVWKLTNVELSDGTLLNGSFLLNVYGYFGTWSLTTTGGTLTDYTYTNTAGSSGQITNPPDKVVTFAQTPGGLSDLTLILTFQNNLSVKTATDAIVGGSSFECVGWSCPSTGDIYVVANQSASLVTPLPAAIWLVGSALACLPAFGVRRRVPA